MTAATKLAAYVAGLALVLAAAFGVGRLAGPIGEPETDAAAHHDTAAGATPTEHSGHDTGSAETTAMPGGLQVSEHGYTLALARTTLPTGTTRLSFRIIGPDGKPVTDFAREHEKELHLIVVRRDLSGYQHLHPVRDADGRWTTDVRFTPGTWRVLADFRPTKHAAMTLGADVDVAGAVRHTPLPEPASSTTVEGYTITLKGALRQGNDGTLDLTVRKGGRPVTDLEPYLGAYGHLVTLRSGDLGYVHVHPEGEPGDGKTASGPTVSFHATAPSAGTYRLYLDFKHDGVVRTAEFTVRTAGAHTPEEPVPSGADTHDHSR